MGEPTSRGLRGLPSLATTRRRLGPEELTAETVRLAGQLAARATVGGGVVFPVAHGEVAIELRELFPLLEDAKFDQLMSSLDRAARFISSAETAEADDTAAYARAAWEAGLDASDFAPDDAQTFRSAVIDHWDLVLLQRVADLVSAHETTLSSPTNEARTA